MLGRRASLPAMLPINCSGFSLRKAIQRRTTKLFEKRIFMEPTEHELAMEQMIFDLHIDSPTSYGYKININSFQVFVDHNSE